MGDVPFALPSSSKWEVADRQDKMGKNNMSLNRNMSVTDYYGCVPMCPNETSVT